MAISVLGDLDPIVDAPSMLVHHHDERKLSHTQLGDIGTSTHEQIDEHIDDSTDPHGAIMAVSTKIQTQKIENPSGDITLDCIDATVDSTVFVKNSDPTFKGNLDIEGKLFCSTLFEKVNDTGVTIDSVLVKDGLVDGRNIAADGTKLDGIASGAVSDHGALSGLTDDDHTQYLLADGSRDLTGTMMVTVANEIQFRNTGQSISSVTASELDIDGTDFVNIRIAGTTQLRINSTDVIFTNRISAITLASTVATGTAPLFVTSTTTVANLRAATAVAADDADTIDGVHATGFILSDGSAPLTADWDVGAFQCRMVSVQVDGPSIGAAGTVTFGNQFKPGTGGSAGAIFAPAGIGAKSQPLTAVQRDWYTFKDGTTEVFIPVWV